jgi:DNA-binding transcriptional ArsR family regulator
LSAHPKPTTASALRGSVAIFGALGDPTRLRIVTRLCNQGPMTVSKITATSGVTRQAVAKHLQVLERAGLVASTRYGRTRVCQLEPSRLDLARRDLERVSIQWDQTLSRLKRFVEE